METLPFNGQLDPKTAFAESQEHSSFDVYMYATNETISKITPNHFPKRSGVRKKTLYAGARCNYPETICGAGS